MNDEDFKEFEKELEEEFRKQNIEHIKAGLRYIQTLKKQLNDKRDKAKDGEVNDQKSDNEKV